MALGIFLIVAAGRYATFFERRDDSDVLVDRDLCECLDRISIFFIHSIFFKSCLRASPSWDLGFWCPFMGLTWSVIYMLKLLYFQGWENAEVRISVILGIFSFVVAMGLVHSPAQTFLDVDLQTVSHASYTAQKCKSTYIFLSSMQDRARARVVTNYNLNATPLLRYLGGCNRNRILNP